MEDEKLVYRASDIMERYGVGRNRALEIIRSIKKTTKTNKLGCGMVLYSELIYWETAIREGEK